jgi:hypothetical protein
VKRQVCGGEFYGSLKVSNINVKFVRRLQRRNILFAINLAFHAKLYCLSPSATVNKLLQNQKFQFLKGKCEDA